MIVIARLLATRFIKTGLLCKILVKCLLICTFHPNFLFSHTCPFSASFEWTLMNLLALCRFLESELDFQEKMPRTTKHCFQWCFPQLVYVGHYETHYLPKVVQILPLRYVLPLMTTPLPVQNFPLEAVHCGRYTVFSARLDKRPTHNEV